MKNLDLFSQKMREDWEERLTFDPDYWMCEPFISEQDYLNSGQRDLGLLLEGLDALSLKDKTALEYGCGTGRLTCAAASIFKSLNAVDVSLTAINRAKERIVSYPAVTLTHCNGVDLSQECSDSYDLVFSYAVLSHFNRTIFASVLYELIRVLKVGGRLRFQLYVGEDPYCRPEEDTITVRGYREDMLREALIKLGCSNIEMFALNLPFDASFEGRLFPMVVDTIKRDIKLDCTCSDLIEILAQDDRSSQESFIECSMLYDLFNRQVKNLAFEKALKTAQFLSSRETRTEKRLILGKAIQFLKDKDKKIDSLLASI